MSYLRIKAVILDWAGTAVDYGSLAPAAALQRVFLESGVEITPAEAREHMGVLKRDQIRFICAGARVNAAWRECHGTAPEEADVERLFAEFIPRQAGFLEEYSTPIPGVCETVERWRTEGLRIGSTTGYTRELLDVVRTAAARQGYAPDASVTPDEACGGRPRPFMCYRNAMLLDVYPLAACVKIGDTASDIAEGLNAGMWTIGITRTGNEIGLPQAALEVLPQAEQDLLEDRAARRLTAAGAHYTARSVAECDSLLAEIERRLVAGERP